MKIKELEKSPTFIEDMERELRRLASEKPDFIYTSEPGAACHYSKGPSYNLKSCDGCIFGQTLQTLGITKEELNELDTDGMDTAIHIIFPFAPRRWKSVQYRQDNGSPWGEAIKALDG